MWNSTGRQYEKKKKQKKMGEKKKQNISHFAFV